jgi:hypothetical protein
MANAAIWASRLGSWPCAARRISPLWPLAHIQGRPCGPTGTLKMRTTTPSSSTSWSSSLHWPDGREAFAPLRISGPNTVSFRPDRSALLFLHPASRNSEQFVRQLSIEILPKCGVRCGGVTVHGFQNETMDFSEGIHERRPLFSLVFYALTLVRHPHLKSPFGQSKPRPLKGRRGPSSLWKVKR